MKIPWLFPTLKEIKKTQTWSNARKFIQTQTHTDSTCMHWKRKRKCWIIRNCLRRNLNAKRQSRPITETCGQTARRRSEADLFLGSWFESRWRHGCSSRVLCRYRRSDHSFRDFLWWVCVRACVCERERERERALETSTVRLPRPELSRCATTKKKVKLESWRILPYISEVLRLESWHPDRTSTSSASSANSLTLGYTSEYDSKFLFVIASASSEDTDTRKLLHR